MSPPQSDTSKPRPSRRRRAIALTLAALVCIGAALAVVPHLLGYGWFGHRAIVYGQSDLYVLNLDEAPRFVAVDGERPVEVDAGKARIIPVVGGDLSVEAIDGDGQRINRWELEANDSDIFVNFSQDRCFVVSRLSNLDDPDNLAVDITERLDADTTMMELESRHTIWPRSYPEGAEQGSSDRRVSLEIVDCSLVENTEFLSDYLEARFRDRLH